jgi:hypothetical protein
MVIPDATPVPGKPDKKADSDAEAGHPAEDLISAAIFIILGVGAFFMALDYRTGTMHRMGPGIFPLLVSGLMIVLGAALAVQALAKWRLHQASGAKTELLPNFAAVRALLFTMVSLLVFAMLVRPAGLLIAMTAMVFIATRAQPGRPIVSSLILAVSLSVLCAAIFVYGIGIPINLWP